MDFADDSMTRIVAFTIDTQVKLVAKTLLFDVGTTGDVMSTICIGDWCRSFVQVVVVLALVSDTRDELERFDFEIINLSLEIHQQQREPRQVQSENQDLLQSWLSSPNSNWCP